MREPYSLPWFMFDLYNYQLITSASIPEGEIRDVKSIFITETPIPGLNYQPVSVGGNGNRKISFTLPIVQRNGIIGNLGIIKQFDALRNQAQGFLGLTRKSGQFSPNPRVLYYWGVGSVPLVYYVTKCDFRHVSGMVGPTGQPKATYIDIELTLDETDPLYQAEEAFRKYAILIGEVESVALITKQRLGMGSPF